jgi:hypothetical protein
VATTLRRVEPARRQRRDAESDLQLFALAAAMACPDDRIHMHFKAAL